jgi:hypothetical protein
MEIPDRDLSPQETGMRMEYPLKRLWDPRRIFFSQKREWGTKTRREFPVSRCHP